MIELLAKNWWALALRGIAAILFGIIALFWPGITLNALIIVFGVYALVDGVFAIVAAVRAVEHHQRWGALLLEGIVSILAGLIALFAPLAAALAFLYVFIAWTLITGVLEIAAAIKLRQHIRGEWLLALNGVISILLGLFLAAYPGIGLIGLVWCIGVYAIIFGVALVALGLRTKRGADRLLHS
ncbi:MAG TPA: HdeD family acid-resistance protein [Alphaproteobacteria bacterium]|nr:HdeD family acid-resistance protein [Alphaproteobacteria bacterium]